MTFGQPSYLSDPTTIGPSHWLMAKRPGLKHRFSTGLPVISRLYGHACESRTKLVALVGGSPQLGSSFWSCTLISLRFSQRVARVRLNTEFVPLLFFPCCGQKHFDFSKKVETFLLSQFFGKGPPGAMPVGLFVIPLPMLMGTGDDSIPTTVSRV